MRYPGTRPTRNSCLFTDEKSSSVDSRALSLWRLVATVISVISILFTLIGCVSAPYEIARMHEKEGELVAELRRAHLAMVDAYVDKKLEVFDDFYFREYGPKFRKNWETTFAAKTGRAYDPDRDFSLLSNDLVASYQNNIEPLNKLR